MVGALPLDKEALRLALEPTHPLAFASSAVECIHHVSCGRQFDLILCPMKMADMSGIELVACLYTTSPDHARRTLLLEDDTDPVMTEQAYWFGIPVLPVPLDVQYLRVVAAWFSSPGVRR